MPKRQALTFGFLLFALVVLLPMRAAAATPHVDRADLVGDINTIMAAYMENAVSRAEADHADALLVVINTPGGISTSMDDIVTSLLNSKVPVIAFVYPSGARSASAGLFVAEAADVLAMAPGTNIGSAHPIQATGADLTGDLGKKVLNDAVTRVRNLAAMHGRNADWAEDAVPECTHRSDGRGALDPARRLRHHHRAHDTGRHLAGCSGRDRCRAGHRLFGQPTGEHRRSPDDASRIRALRRRPQGQHARHPQLRRGTCAIARHGLPHQHRTVRPWRQPDRCACCRDFHDWILRVLHPQGLGRAPASRHHRLRGVGGLQGRGPPGSRTGRTSLCARSALEGSRFERPDSCGDPGPRGGSQRPAASGRPRRNRSKEGGRLMDVGTLVVLGVVVGLLFIIPFGIDRLVKIDLRVITLEVPPQEVITNDNVTAKVNAVIYFQVVDAQRAVTQVLNYINATSQIAQTTLRAALGQATLDDLLANREKINQNLQKIIDEQTEPWGIKVSVVEIKDVELPQTMQRAMAKQAEAEREKRAKIINADGEFQASQTLANAAQVISSQQGALQLRFLQTMVEIGSEKNTTIILPLPIELIKPLIDIGRAADGSPTPLPEKGTKTG